MGSRLRLRAFRKIFQIHVTKHPSPWSNKTMELRNHPLMSYRGVASWPPTWTKTGTGEQYRAKDILHGEVGTLEEVIFSRIEPDARIFLVIQVAGKSYMGTLLFQDAAFCRHIADLLQAHLGKTIKEIGHVDLSYTV